MNIEDAFEESFRELGLDLDGDPDDILAGTGESDEESEDVDGPEATESVNEQPSGEDAPAEDDDESERPNAVVVDLPENGVLRLPDGTEVDAANVIAFQRDYTKKTQQLAEERKNFEAEREQITSAYEQVKGWYEERSADPTAWVQEIISGSEDPTATIARALYELANDGKLDPAFVATFGIDAGEVADRVKTTQRDREIDELRRKVDDRERGEAEQARIREQAAIYQSQWDEIKQTHSLAFDDAEVERESKRELLQFAIESKLGHSLTDAYDLMLVRRGRSVKPAVSKDPAVEAKKRASRAVTQKSSGSAGARQAAKPLSTRDAALQALSEFAAAG